MILFYIWIICGIISAIIASNKGRSGVGWFFGGLILGPLGLLIIAVLSKKEEEIEDKKIETGECKKCPQCAELVKMEAKICRFCRYEFKESDNKKFVPLIKKSGW